MAQTVTPSIAPNTREFRSLYLMRDDLTLLNHGSFGACPREVFERYQKWQRDIEYEPVRMLALERDFSVLMREARTRLGEFLNVDADDLVFHPNSSTALNQVARSLPLHEGDEILGNIHEYGAMERAWRFVARHTGARWIGAPLDLPVHDEDDVVERIWSHVTPRTRVLFISHITSPTALTLPVKKLCARAREAGIWSVVDGAHAPSYLELDVRDVGADFYAGNCHKWLSAPKGSAFLYARRELQPLLEPLVITWGYSRDTLVGPPPPSLAGRGLAATVVPGSQYIDENEYQATRDPSAYLTVPAAIDFQRKHDWKTVRRSCRALAEQARQRIAALTGLPPLAPPEFYSQMCAMPLPPGTDVKAMKSALYTEWQVEIPVYEFQSQPIIRISVQAYNTQADVDRLVAGLEALLHSR